MMIWYGQQGLGTAWSILMMVVMLAFWGGIAALVVYAVRGRLGNGEVRGSEPAQILAERLARGEIDAEEYRSRLQVLSAPR